MASVNPSIESVAVTRSLEGKRFHPGEAIFQIALLLALGASLMILLVLLGDVLNRGLGLLLDRKLEFITSSLSTFSPMTAGVWQGLVGSFVTLIFVLVIAVPLGICSAIYLEEYASDTRFNRFINVNIRNLAGVPSIVYGLLGLALFVTLLKQVTGGKSMIAAGLTLGVLVLPIVIITSAEALRAVPQTIREAGYGVGATRWEVVRFHVLPAASPGILTGVVLSLARALGETAPVLLVGAVTGFLASGGASFYHQLYQPFTTLPTVIYTYAQQPSQQFRAVTAAAIIVLLAVILTANATAIILRNRYERKW
ncbi:MAG: phosphate ABC transporter permease PstA [Actinobacteria bacterium]|nr:phosphate ABC transporter permease PstA [Actinomycetota bacterium]